MKGHREVNFLIVHVCMYIFARFEYFDNALSYSSNTNTQLHRRGKAKIFIDILVCDWSFCENVNRNHISVGINMERSAIGERSTRTNGHCNVMKRRREAVICLVHCIMKPIFSSYHTRRFIDYFSLNKQRITQRFRCQCLYE